jgi:hypothetical protein
MRCTEPQAARRFQIALPFVQSEYEIALNAQDRRMTVQIGTSFLRTDR